MTTLTVGMSNDYRLHASTKPFVLFSLHVSQAIQRLSPERVIVLWKYQHERAMWDEMWERVPPDKRVPVIHRNAGGSDTVDSDKLAYMPASQSKKSATAPDATQTSNLASWVSTLAQHDVSIPDAESVKRFVERFPYTIPAIQASIPLIKHYFPDAHRVVIDTFDEAEGLSGPEHQSLIVTIEMKPLAPDALVRLENFDAEWWHPLTLDVGMRVGSYLRFI